jgi:hypothetical protein
MSLKHIFEGRPGGWQFDDQPALTAVLPGYELTEKEAKEAVKALELATIRNDSANMVGWLVVGLTRSPTHFLSEARDGGLFRLSRYDYRHDALTKLLHNLVERVTANTFVVPPSTARYFENVLRLHTVCQEIHEIVGRLVDTLRERGHAGLKAMLMMVDFAFMIAERKGDRTDKAKPSTHLFFFSPEDLAEGFSLAFDLFIKQPRGWPLRNEAIDMERALTQGEPETLLRNGALVRYYREMEVMVDAYGFTLEPVSETRFELHPPYSDFLRAMRYGYMRFESQLHAHLVRSHDKDRPRLSELAARFMDAVREACVAEKDNPKRFIFQIPMVEPLLAALDARWLYQEEYATWSFASMELMTPLEDLLQFEVVKGITMKDILEFHRCVNFLRWFAGRFLMDRLNEDAPMVLQSLLLAQKRAQYVEFFGQLIDKKKVEGIVDLFAYLPGRDAFFDVQYQPIVRTANDGVLFALNIFGTSNIVRNVLQLTRKRKYHDGTFDPLKNMARESLGKRADYVYPKDLKFEVGERKSDVDVLVLWSGILFVLECKNPLHPTGPFELRNSYEYIIKANRQLDLFRSGFSDPDFRESIGTRIGYELPEGTPLVTGILVSNRMFLGLRIGENSVRNAFEMRHFLKEGTIIVGDQAKHFWKDKPTAQDLVAFFGDDLYVKKNWAAMTEFREEYKIGRFEISALAQKLDMEKVADNLEMPEVAARIRASKEEYLARIKEQEAEIMQMEERAERVRRGDA